VIVVTVVGVMAIEHLLSLVIENLWLKIAYHGGLIVCIYSFLLFGVYGKRLKHVLQVAM
jgi:energy-converting hydrogenase Eha subunit H